MTSPDSEDLELEEERLALEEDRTRYDSVIPGLSSERPASDPGRGASGSPPGAFAGAGAPAERPDNDRERSGSERGGGGDWCGWGRPPDRVSPPPGCGFSLNLRAITSQVEQSSVPRDVANRGAEYVVIEGLKDCVVKRVAWLWPGRIPLAKLTMLVGDPNVGKSLLTVDMAARVTRGLPFPDRPQIPVLRGQVLILSSEDTSADTLVPRLEAAGADMKLVSRLHWISGQGTRATGEDCTWTRPIILPDDIKALESYLQPYFAVSEEQREYRDGEFVSTGRWTRPDLSDFPPVRLIILDTLASYLPRVGSGDNVFVRKMLQPLVDLAERYQVAVVAVNHLNKAVHQAGQYRPLGSLAFTAVSRAVWGLARDPHDFERRLLLPVKMNLGPTPSGLAFRIEGLRLAWEEKPIEITWPQALSVRRQESASRLRYAAEILTTVLADGPMPYKKIEALAHEAGIKTGTLIRAKDALQLNATQHFTDGVQYWTWELPA